MSVRTFPSLMVAIGMLCGCSTSLFTQSKGSLVAIATPKPGPDDKESPSVEVAGVNLLGEVLDPNSNTTTSARVDVIDEVATTVTHSADTGTHNQFKLPVLQIHAHTLALRLKVNGRYFFADVALPADIIASVNALRVQSGLEPLKDSQPARGGNDYLDSRKLMLVLPANGHIVAHTDENILTGISKQTVTAVSMPKVNTANPKSLGVWTSVENQSMQSFMRFAWQKTFDSTSRVRLVLAKSEADASGWDGQDASVPVWTGRVPGDVVLKDFSQCTDPTVSGRPTTGMLSASNASACGLSSSAFPFGETDVFFVRLAAESNTELNLSAVFRISKLNAAPALSAFSVIHHIDNGETLTLPFTLMDADSAVSCSQSMTAQSSNPNLLPNGNISFSGSAPDCTVSLASVANQMGITTVTLTAADGQGGTSSQSFSVSRGWYPHRHMKSSNADSGDHFGSRVALSGDVLAASAPDEDSDQTIITNGTNASTNNAATDSGAVYVYRNSGGIWNQEAFIKAANTSSSVNHFGTSIALSGSTLAVGAPGEDFAPQDHITNSPSPPSGSTSGHSDSGAAYIYGYTGTQWQQQAYIKADNSGINDRFGAAVALDGDVLAVGAPNEDSVQNIITNASLTDSAVFGGDDSSQDAGAVYVYRRSSGGLWAFDAYIKSPAIRSGDSFGVDVSLSGDTLAVGANGDDWGTNTIVSGTAVVSTEATRQNSGAVYIFKHTSALGWHHEAYIKSFLSTAEDGFGTAVSLSGDTLAVGVPFDNSAQETITNGSSVSSDNSRNNSGAVYIYRRLSGVWMQQAYLKAPQNSSGDKFGFSVSLSGNSLAVGAIGEASERNSIAAGGNYTSNESAPNAGAVYVFTRSGTSWSLDAFVKSRFANLNDEFGHSVALDGNTLAVGASHEDTPLNYEGDPASVNALIGSGAVHIFKR